MSEDSSILKDERITVEAELNTRSLHELARNGQIEGLRAILEQGTVNVNSLCRTEGLEPLTPLACAVKNGSIECISLLLDYGAQLNMSKHLDKSARKHPLVCALENRNQDVIKYIVSKGADVKLAFAVLSNLNHPSLYNALNVKVDLELSEISILELQETPPNFEALRELLEPEILCACKSPIDMALDLEQACLVAAGVSMEHAAVYQQLAKQCQTFAKDFLACCQVPSDVELLLSMKDADNTFGRALKYNEKEFLTQPWIQVVCEKQWLGELDEYRNICVPFVAVLKVLFAPLLVPIFTLRGLLCGRFHCMYKLIQLISSPCLCFFSFIMSHLLFFIILMILCTCKTRKHPTPIEILSWVWLLGKLLSDCMKYYKVIRLTSFKVSLVRGLFDAVYVLFFAALFCVRVYTANKDGNVTLFIFVADILYSIGAILHVLQLMYVLQVTKFLGPILVSMRYFLWELFRFLTILLIIIMTFSIAITKIFNAYGLYGSNLGPDAVPDTLSQNFYHFTDISTTLFWATFGLVDLNDHDFKTYRTHIISDLLIAVYIILSTGLLVMLLFAMINYQYTKAKKRFETEWRYLSAKLTHEFSLSHPTIIPFNLISLPVCLITQTLVRIFGDEQKMGLFGGKDKVVEPHLVYYIQSKVVLNPDCEEERQALIQALAEIYLTKASWPGIKQPRTGDNEEEADAHSMTSSPTGLLDPALALERMSCNLEKQEHTLSQLRRENQELALKMDILLRRVTAQNSTDC